MNYYTRFGTGAASTLTDSVLKTNFEVNGIPANSVAYTNVLNGMLRQISAATQALAQFIFEETSATVNSSSFDAALFRTALSVWVADQGFATDSQMPFIKGDNLPSQTQVKVWVGTEAQYNAITPDPDTLYFIR